MTAAAPATTRYEVVIGVEIHVQLKTASKMFCGCSTAVRGAPPNTLTCPVCLGSARRPAGDQPEGRRARPVDRAGDRRAHPRRDPLGSQELLLSRPAQGLPDLAVRPAAGRRRVADGRDVRWTRSRWASDAPTSRRTRPACCTRPAPAASGSSLVDFNRSGIPLMEIVTEPVIPSAEAARRYAEELRLLLLTIGASDAADGGGPDASRGQRFVARGRYRLRSGRGSRSRT